jgi:hypothetical protein
VVVLHAETGFPQPCRGRGHLRVLDGRELGAARRGAVSAAEHRPARHRNHRRRHQPVLGETQQGRPRRFPKAATAIYAIR